jgi:carboxymethylenebutenolidase
MRFFSRIDRQSQRGLFWGALFALALSLSLLVQACQNSPPANSQTAGQAQQSADSMAAIAREHSGDTPTPTPMAMAEPSVPVTAQEVVYATVDGQPITGYLARPESATEAEALPAIITIHEWWGLNDNIKSVTRRLAGEGYTVLAVDLYNGEVASEPAQARELTSTVTDNPGPAQDNITQAAQFLTNEYAAPKLGSLGWCFGGNWSLRAGLLLDELDAVALYYGQLILDADALDELNAPLIGIFGEADSSIPVADVESFEATLTELSKTADINLYPGVGHAFANPSGQNYNAEAAEAAWTKTTDFFATHLQDNQTES